MIINKRVTFIVILLSLILLVFSLIGTYCYRVKINEYITNGIVQTAFFKDKETKKESANLPDYPFRVGEKLKYGIYSMRLKVGDATITYLGKKELNGILTSCITLEARGPGFYDLEKIYGDIEDYSPIRVEREIRLFGNNINITEDYKQNNEVLITRKSKETETKKIKSKEKMSNIILLLYHFRFKKDYKIGDSFKFNLPTKKLNMIVDKETEIKISKEKFKAIFVKSLPEQFKVWFRSDTDRLPLRLQGAIGFGNMYLELKEVD